MAYKAGAKKLISMSKFIFDKFDVPYVSAFAISRSNLNRSKQSINILVKILREFIDEYLSNLSKFDFNLIFVLLNKKLVKLIKLEAPLLYE